MAIRWLYKTWSFFWGFIGITIMVVVVLAIAGFGALQLPSTKTYIANQAEERFNNSYQGVLTFGAIQGTIPFNFELYDVSIYPDSSSYIPVFHADTITASLDVWALVRNRFLITGMNVGSPSVIFDSESDNSFLRAIQRKDNGTSITVEGEELEDVESFVEILAPSMVVRNGTAVFRNVVTDSSVFLPSDSLTLRTIDLEMFLDYNSEQRFLDIEHLSMRSPELGNTSINLYGQIFNDSRFLEFNAFNIRSGRSVLNFSGEADGVDLFKGKLFEQIRSSDISLNLEEMVLWDDQIRKYNPNVPEHDQSLYLSMAAEGSLDSLWFDEFQIVFGNSEASGFGYITNPLNPQDIRVGGELDRLVTDTTDLKVVLPKLTEVQNTAIAGSDYQLSYKADSRSFEGSIAGVGNRGSFNLGGKYVYRTDSLSIVGRIDSLDVGNLFSDDVFSSKLSGDIDITSSSLDVRKANGRGSITLSEGEINSIPFDSLDASGNWGNGIITPRFFGSAHNSDLSGMGTIDFSQEIPAIEFSGSGRNLDMKAITRVESMQEALVDVEYEIFLNGSNRDNVYGQVSLDIPFSVIAGDTLPSHQFYADFNEPGIAERSLRITSTALDITVDGQYSPNELAQLYPYWKNYFEARVEEELLFGVADTTVLERPQIADQNFNLAMTVKNLDLLRAYFPAFPYMRSNMEMVSDVNVNPDRLLFNASVRDPKFEWGITQADTVNMQITGSFRHQDMLKAYSGLQVQLNAEAVHTEFLNGKDLDFNFDMDEDSVRITHSIGKIQDDTIFRMGSEISLSDTLITGRINNFELGNERYMWKNEGVPALMYTLDEKLVFENFSFVNMDEYLSFSGTFSNLPEDSVNYVVRSVDLQRISDLINGRINFSGDLDGTFTTRALTRIPTIQGNLEISGLAIENNVVGDIELSSNFNAEKNRFDTDITIKTDSTIYPEYFVRNTRAGQDIELSGYVLAPAGGEFPAVDSLYKFRLDFESVDLWVIPFIAPKVFTEMSGRATGHGYIWGNLETYDFNVDYQVGMDDAVYMKPNFLGTSYFAQGDVSFSRHRGLDFKGLYIIDPSGGSAILSGTYDFNDFKDLDYIDLTLQMDEFQFLNSTFAPDLPFFGQVYGTSTVRLTGTNLNPVLTTLVPVTITDFSRVGIPLLEETDFDASSQFIRFVDDFSKTGSRSGSTAGGTQFALEEERDPFDRTFMERFTLDFQFVAVNPMMVELIFDPITGDMIRADGTGRLRILLRDQELTMFGQFDITGGSYNFVSGDIFTRRFELESGGTITWEGAPDDARLNLNAIYQARPDINTLTQARSEIETSQRVPVELVLHVGGSLSAIDNDFFFRLPNTFETRQNTTLQTQINNLNRNEDEKLIQATSFLLMGDFIPYSALNDNDASTSIGSNFSSSGAVLNPLLSSQVISPLLSNQINSLLRSDVGTLDIDFNLNTYNNVDLAVALRLYNDRIILSREGQITGSQSSIGDLGATYRINQTLSVTAFHRQDPTFSTFTSTDESQQFQDINGVGVEAELTFNTWNEFFKKLASPFRRLFGTKEKEEGQAVTATSQN